MKAWCGILIFSATIAATVILEVARATTLNALIQTKDILVQTYEQKKNKLIMHNTSKYQSII